MDFGGRLGFLRYVVGRVVSGPADISIHHRPGDRTTVGGRVPASKVGAIQEFFDRDLKPSGVVRVWGTYGPRRALKLRFAGPMTVGQRQRARNFLLELLR